MIINRVIPCLLLDKGGLVKTVRFRSPTYIGDPINAVKIFNDKEVDELVFLDISASREKRGPDFRMLKDLASECFMPLAYGGGIRTIEEIRELFRIGIEKVVINTAALEDSQLIGSAARIFGSQSIVASVDVKKSLLGNYSIYSHSKRKVVNKDPFAYMHSLQAAGAGEILLNSVDRDGTMGGYDLTLIERVVSSLTVPVVAMGGAGSVDDLVSAVRNGGASAAAAGSMFVFHGPNRAVLITYPSQEELKGLLAKIEDKE